MLKSKLLSFLMTIGCLSPIIGTGLFIYLLIQLEFGKAFLYGFLSFVIMIVVAAMGGNISEKKKEKHKNMLLSLKPAAHNFHDSLSTASDDLRSKITIDNVNKQFYIWRPQDEAVKTIDDVKPDMPYQVHSYKPSDILSVEHIEDATVLSKITRQSASARFFLDGLPAFEIEPVTEKKSDNEVNLITLKLIVNDKANPIHMLHLYINPSLSLQKNMAEYKQIQTDIQKWLTSFHLMMKEADWEEGSVENGNHEQTYDVIHDQVNTGMISHAPGKSMQVISEQNTIIRTRLLPLLNQVMHQKVQGKSSFTTLSEDAGQTSSYFDELLKKNREMMYGKHEK